MQKNGKKSAIEGGSKEHTSPLMAATDSSEKCLVKTEGLYTFDTASASSKAMSGPRTGIRNVQKRCEMKIELF